MKQIAKEQKYRYNVINKHGNQEAWSGVFESLAAAEKWYERHGSFHEANGHKLVLVKCVGEEDEKMAKKKKRKYLY
jgi:hypothetical protein